MLMTLTDQDTLRDLSRGAVYAYMADVHGDIAEFGCFAGDSARALAAQIQQCEKTKELNRKLWLFDSFEGLPKATLPPDTESPHVKDGTWAWTVTDGPKPEQIKLLCSAFMPADYINVIPGWYKDTLSQIPTDTKFALVHIDCDLYESAYQVLDHLFGNDMLSDGCALFFDDWYCNRGSHKFGENRALFDARAKHNMLSPYVVTDWGAYGIVGRKFIYHG